MSRDARARTTATAFTIAIHAALAVALIFSVTWKRDATPPSTPLEAELFRTPQKLMVDPAPPPEPQRVTPPPPAVEPKPEPKVEPPPVVKSPDADIAIKKAKEKEKQEADKRALELEKKKEADAKAAKDKAEKAAKEKLQAEQKEKLRRDAERDAALAAMRNEADTDRKSVERSLAQEAQREAAAAKEAAAKRAAERAAADRTAAENAATQQLAQKQAQDSAARAGALADYIARVRNKVRGNLVLSQQPPGNPEAIFEITQLPTGEVVGVALRKSSGQRYVDEAIERAIHKSSPLPKPDSPDLFQRTLNLRFRPNEN